MTVISSPSKRAVATVSEARGAVKAARASISTRLRGTRVTLPRVYGASFLTVYSTESRRTCAGRRVDVKAVSTVEALGTKAFHLDNINYSLSRFTNIFLEESQDEKDVGTPNVNDTAANVRYSAFKDCIAMSNKALHIARHPCSVISVLVSLSCPAISDKIYRLSKKSPTRFRYVVKFYTDILKWLTFLRVPRADCSFSIVSNQKLLIILVATLLPRKVKRTI